MTPDNTCQGIYVHQVDNGLYGNDPHETRTVPESGATRIAKLRAGSAGGSAVFTMDIPTDIWDFGSVSRFSLARSGAGSLPGMIWGV